MLLLLSSLRSTKLPRVNAGIHVRSTTEVTVGYKSVTAESEWFLHCNQDVNRI